MTPLVIGIAGGTGSGKTTVAHALASAMPEGRCVVVEHDAYYKDLADRSPEERAAVNFDHPDALDSALLAEHLRRLRAGESVELPIYDFVTHTRRRETRRVAPAPLRGTTAGPRPRGAARPSPRAAAGGPCTSR